MARDWCKEKDQGKGINDRLEGRTLAESNHSARLGAETTSIKQGESCKKKATVSDLTPGRHSFPVDLHKDIFCDCFRPKIVLASSVVALVKFDLLKRSPKGANR